MHAPSAPSAYLKNPVIPPYHESVVAEQVLVATNVTPVATPVANTSESTSNTPYWKMPSNNMPRDTNRRHGREGAPEETKCFRNFGGYHNRSLFCFGFTMLCILCANGFLSLMCVNCACSLASLNSILSVASINSVMSIHSVNSFLSINCSGGFMSHCSD